MRFASSAEWITGTPGSRYSEYIEDFIDIPDLEAGGMTCLGSALQLLEKGLSRNSMLYSPTGNRRPIIIIMTDGLPTDDWKSAFKSIQKNHWFQQSTRIGIALGDQADGDMLSELVGSSEGVMCVTDISLFAQMLVNVSVSSSLANSNSIILPPEPEGKQGFSADFYGNFGPFQRKKTPTVTNKDTVGESETIPIPNPSVLVIDPFDDQSLE